MNARQFDITLLSDVAVTADASTVGGHSGLDFLPGSLFLGAAAAGFLREKIPFDPEFFFSGKVRFLDAFPLIEDERAFPVPLAFHTLKEQDWKGQKPFNLLTSSVEDAESQLKQWRKGYMNSKGSVCEIRLESGMKTAIDRRYRRSKEAQLFGYESMPAGTRYRMIVQSDVPEFFDRLIEFFGKATLRLGRSRGAEYGSVEVKDAGNTAEIPVFSQKDGVIAIQLLADLALSENCLPVLLPTPAHFGIQQGELVPEKTFLRSRRYTPWNSFYNCRTTERQVLCKGGVIVFKTKSEVDIQALQHSLSRGVGQYREEGLGQVAVNPPWLFTPPVLKKQTALDVETKTPCPETPLTKYLRQKSKTQASSYAAFSEGVRLAKKWSDLSQQIKKDGYNVPGKSQWGTIRELTVRSGGDTEKLLASLKEFCTEDLRSQLWTREGGSFSGGKGKAHSLYSLMISDIKEMKSKDPETPWLTLFHASVEMGRELSRHDKKEAEKK